MKISDRDLAKICLEGIQALLKHIEEIGSDRSEKIIAETKRFIDHAKNCLKD